MDSPRAMCATTKWRGPGSYGPWLRSPVWDVCCITGSSILVVIPLLLYEWFGTSATFVNLCIAGVIGGPHMYATFFRTTFDPTFRRQHRYLMLTSCAIPGLVIVCGLWHFRLLITIFFFWASIHVLHQIIYLLGCYDRTQGRAYSAWSRTIDSVVVMSSLYPLAAYRFLHDEFSIGGTLLLYPTILKTPLVYYAIASVFLLACVLFLGKTITEIRQGSAHYPKIALILTTVFLALLITSYTDRRLEIAFQGFNTWHSFQYLALTWYVTTLRQQRGEIEAPLLRRFAATGRFRHFYGVNVLLALGALLLIAVVTGVTGMTFQQSYYIVVLSFLLVHYYHDHVLFTAFDAVVPQPLPVRA